jgi:hydroxymethylpyrimidine pyrophosphatase-like HAD family hydrolase
MFFPSDAKGIIALDIDGTLTAETYTIDPSVIEVLNSYHQEGWHFVFITGRPFQWSFRTLQSLSFPYSLAIQNGALLLQMPTRKVLLRHYLNKEILPGLDEICQNYQTDCVIYVGMENEDVCLYRPDRFSTSLLSYVENRAGFLKEKWKIIHSLEEIPATFASIKCFAHEVAALALSSQIEKRLSIHAPPNKDPFNGDYFVIQGTHPKANKGFIAQQYQNIEGNKKILIAAGDDYNDQSMLQVADIKIVMKNAPLDLLKMADIIAPPASEKGLIVGLAQAMQLAEDKEIL